MAIEVRPADVFDDVAAVLGPQTSRRQRVLVPQLPADVVQGEPELERSRTR
jgi:hypothetical protein